VKISTAEFGFSRRQEDFSSRELKRRVLSFPDGFPRTNTDASDQLRFDQEVIVKLSESTPQTEEKRHGVLPD
jgi:hypothetical protein